MFTCWTSRQNISIEENLLHRGMYILWPCAVISLCPGMIFVPVSFCPKNICFTTWGWGKQPSMRDEAGVIFTKMRDACHKLGYNFNMESHFDEASLMGEADVVVVVDLIPAISARLVKCMPPKVVLILWELPTVCPHSFSHTVFYRMFDKIYTLYDDLGLVLKLTEVVGSWPVCF